MDHKKTLLVQSQRFFFIQYTENQLKKFTLKGNGSATVVVLVVKRLLHYYYYSAYYTTMVQAVPLRAQ
jgi:hypothetical protein